MAQVASSTATPVCENQVSSAWKEGPIIGSEFKPSMPCLSSPIANDAIFAHPHSGIESYQGRETAPHSKALFNIGLNYMSMGSEKEPRVSSPEEQGRTVTEKYADVTLRLLEDHGDQFGPLTPETEKKLRRKLYLRLMILLSAINIMLFVDKSTLGYAAILGLFKETGVTPAQYNNLNTIFYVGYLAFQWPGHYLMQRLPFGKFVASVVFSWSVVIFLHCVAVRYEGLIVMRLALGAAEAVIVPAMEITIGMFFNRHEQSFLQPVLWITCQAAPIFTGFISYGLLWSTGPVLPWKLLHIVTGGITLGLAVWVWIDYPANPAEARWLTLEEKVQVIRRVHASMQSSIEQKQFKKEQFVETLKDPVSWLFALQSFTLMYANNLNYGQKNLITTSIGINPLGSTLVAVAGGGLGVACCIVATFMLRRFPRNLALHGTVWCLPAVAGGIGMMAIDWENKIALLACLILSASVYGITCIIALGWTTSTAAGYTKKLTRNVMFMMGYSVGNLVSPQIWVPSQGPRFYGAWASMIAVSWVGTPAILWIIRVILARRNRERREWIATLSDDERDGGFVEQVDESGQVVRVKVDIAVLDLTDLENKFFIYPL
ncbi:allantoate permease of the major facilitator superfamily [Apiospora arundinis]